MANVIVIGAGIGVRTGSITPVDEKYVLKALGIVALKEHH